VKLEKNLSEGNAMCGNNSCFGGNIWWIIILVLLLGCGNGCGNNDCGCGNNNNGGCGCY